MNLIDGSYCYSYMLKIGAPNHFLRGGNVGIALYILFTVLNINVKLDGKSEFPSFLGYHAFKISFGYIQLQTIYPIHYSGLLIR